MTRAVFPVANVSITMPGGYPMLIQLGTHWSADDPVVKDHPDLFSEDARHGMCYSQPPAPETLSQESPLEEMTVNPGERRSTKRPVLEQM